LSGCSIRLRASTDEGRRLVEKSDRQSSAGTRASRLWPLLGLNVFMADMQSGIGPFLGVFLLAHGWQSGWIGTPLHSAAWPHDHHHSGRRHH